jgi:hypothetical protein
MECPEFRRKDPINLKAFTERAQVGHAFPKPLVEKRSLVDNHLTIASLVSKIRHFFFSLLSE